VQHTSENVLLSSESKYVFTHSVAHSVCELWLIITSKGMVVPSAGLNTFDPGWFPCSDINGSREFWWEIQNAVCLCKMQMLLSVF